MWRHLAFISTTKAPSSFLIFIPDGSVAQYQESSSQFFFPEKAKPEAKSATGKWPWECGSQLSTLPRKVKRTVGDLGSDVSCKGKQWHQHQLIPTHLQWMMR